MNIVKTIVAVLFVAITGIVVFYPLDTFVPASIVSFLPAFLIEEPLIVLIQQYWIVLFVLVPLGAIVYILKEIW